MLAIALIPDGIEYHLPHHIPTSLGFTWLVWLIIGILVIAARRKARFIPGAVQLVVESFLSFIFNLADEIIGPLAPRYYPLLVGLFFYILCANLIGLIPGCHSPTSDPNMTFGLVLIVFLYYNFDGLRTLKFGYFKQFVGPPLPWFLSPLKILIVLTELMTFISRPFSLGLRLFCNMLSKELFLQILGFLLIQFLFSSNQADKILAVLPIFMRPFIILLGLVIAFIQAFVFLMLSIQYIAGAVKASEH
ncbi:MAG: F0F1 ATP synthase subunit A [Chitinivibrionales bacterium]|nr:F0F1 ATP synthase subunit A [Chitinivibrionales bacterium]